MTYDLEAAPRTITLREGGLVVKRVTVAFSQKVRVYGTLADRPVMLTTNVWFASWDDLEIDTILARMPETEYTLREILDTGQRRHH